MKRLSVIVPMYNVEKYVERCIRSLEKQDIPKDDYEIICINDGSPDNSRDVVRNLQNEFDNIVLIDQENQGVSMARNNGIDIASGKYLLMVDPDDYIKHDVLKERLEVLDQNNLDIGFTGFIILDETGNEEFRYDPLYPNNRVLTGIDYYNEFRQENFEKRDPHRTWSVFFKTSFFATNNIRYLSNVPYLEDGELLARSVCLADRVMFIQGPLYMRTTRLGSATHSDLYYSEKARNGFIKAANNLLNFKEHVCISNHQKTFINSYIVHFTIVAIMSMGTIGYFKLYNKMHKVLKGGGLRKLDTEGCSHWYMKMAKHYNLSMHLFFISSQWFRIQRSLRLRIRRLIN